VRELLALNVGNTSVQAGLFLGDRLCATGRWLRKDEAAWVEGIRGFVRKTRSETPSCVAATVVPKARSRVLRSLRGLGLRPLLAEIDLRVPLRVRYRPRSSLGVDRLVNGLAADRIYRRPTIVVDIGTAVTLDIVDGQGTFLGGCIAPGLEVLASALHTGTAQLPLSDLRRPRRVVANTTRGGLRVGLGLGFAGLVSRLVQASVEELGGDVHVVATGGGAPRVAGDVPEIVEVRDALTLEGLARLSSETGRTG